MRLPTPSAAVRYGRTWTPTLRYVMETEVHVYAFSIAANVLLSAWPFVIVLVSVCRYYLHWPAAVDAIYFALNDFLPGDVGEFFERNLRRGGFVRPLEITSLVLLLFTANGIFEPLEVALNRAWGVTKNRSFVRNQLVSMGLIFACGGLAMLSVVLTAFRSSVPEQFGAVGWLANVITTVFFRAVAIPVSVFMLFLVYWLLPNRKINPREVIAPAILVGIALEALKYFNLLVWPLMAQKLSREYGVFINSVTIILWSFLGSMIVLAGAEHTARNQASRAVVVKAPRERSSADTSRL